MTTNLWVEQVSMFQSCEKNESMLARVKALRYVFQDGRVDSLSSFAESATIHSFGSVQGRFYFSSPTQLARDSGIRPILEK